MSASWFNPDESGHGIMIHLLDGELAWMCWFTFDLAGNPAWICALGTISGDTIDFAEAFTVDGGNFPPLFDPAQIVEVPWGSITVTFSGCDTGMMGWSTNAAGFESGNMPLTRLTSLWGSECVPLPPPDSNIKLGLWEGTLPSAPAGSGRLSFRVTSGSSLTFLSSKVPTFNDMNGCDNTWNHAVTIDASQSFTAELSSGNTALTFAGSFDSDVTASGEVVGVCDGSLMLLGQTFEAEWVSN
jgi:hypothetical protein